MSLLKDAYRPVKPYHLDQAKTIWYSRKKNSRHFRHLKNKRNKESQTKYRLIPVARHHAHTRCTFCNPKKDPS